MKKPSGLILVVFMIAIAFIRIDLRPAFSGQTFDQGKTAKTGAGIPQFSPEGDLDPNWKTFLGGTNGGQAESVVLDAAGNVYVAGWSQGPWGSPVRPFNGDGAKEAFVAKLSGSGVLQWHTFLGGAGEDEGRGIALDASGNIYVTGWSLGVLGAPIRSFAGTEYEDAFVAKLNGSGILQWNTFLGGAYNDWGHGVAAGADGNVYVTGASIGSWGSPVRPASGQDDAFVAKLAGNGSLVWHAFLGGPSFDRGNGIALDANGHVYVTGFSKDTWGSPLRAFSGDTDAFVAKLRKDGFLTWNTFLGGTAIDVGEEIDLDSTGNVYVAGTCWGSWGTPLRSYSGLEYTDAFAAKLDAGGTLQWNTFLGGSGADSGTGLAVGTDGSVCVTASSVSTWGLPVRPFFGNVDGCIALLSGTGALRWNTFLGRYRDGLGADIALTTSGVALDASGNLFVVGSRSVPGYDGNGIFIGRIGVPTIDVHSPNFEEAFWAGSATNIAWGTTDTITDVKIEYSTDSGMQWTTVIASTANTGNYAWALPWTDSTHCLVRISDAANAGTFDVSDAAFGINIRTVISLSRDWLSFCAVQGGAATQAQSVIIGNAGGGSLHWNAATEQSWLDVTPAAGTGAGLLRVSVRPDGLAPGHIYFGKISVVDMNAANSPQEIWVGLTVLAAGTSSAPFGDFATPLEGTTGIAGAVPVTGWVLDDVEAVSVKIWREACAGETPGLWFVGDAIFVDGARPDVELDYRDYPFASRAGWGYMLLTNFLPDHGNGTFTLHAVAADRDGHVVTLGTRTITCDNAHAVKPFGTIDTPAQGGIASGNAYVNFGWVLTPWNGTVPKDGRTITVYVDGVPLGHLGTPPNLYNAYRSDVSNNFPGLNNTGGPLPGQGGPVGAFFIDTTGYANGVHTIHWIAYDDLGRGEGIGSRFFSILNENGAPGPPPEAEIPAERKEVPSDYATLPRSIKPVRIRTGFDLNAEFQPRLPDKNGRVRIEIPEVNRLEIDFGGDDPEAAAREPGLARISGGMLAGNALKPLPVGSTLDRRTGRFSWAPGPGFLGSYTLVFVRRAALGEREVCRVEVAIVAKR